MRPEEEQFLKGISEVIGRVPTIGGSCADNEIVVKIATAIRAKVRRVLVIIK